jgi:8-oxo-dGTP diphosphatase
MSIPQFGNQEPGKAYPDRPAAFVIVERAGKVAVVRVTLAGGANRLDLPGGGLDPGESEKDAANRECGEEAGLKVSAETEITRADHFFTGEDGVTVNTRGVFFAARLIAEAPELKIEDDHALEWMTPYEALAGLDRESHLWALAAWLRVRR